MHNIYTFKQEFDLFFWYFYNPNHLFLLKSSDKTLFQSRTKFLKHHLMCFAISCCKGDARYFTEGFSPILESPWAPTEFLSSFRGCLEKKAN